MEQLLIEYWDKALSVVAVLVLLVLVTRKMLQARELSDLPQGLSRSTRKQLLAARRSGKEFAVADVLFAAEEYEAAAELFAKLNTPSRAAECYERAGKRAMAIQAYRRANQHEAAAKLALKHKMYSIAAKTFVEIGRSVDAADCYVKGQEPAKAAELYAEAGRYSEAAGLYEKLKMSENAAELYVSHFTEAMRLARGDINAAPEAAVSARRAAAILTRLDRRAEAAELLRRAGSIPEAGALFEELGALEEAARTYREGGENERAAMLLDRLGRTKEAAMCRAESFLESGDEAGAAEELAKAGEYERSAEFYLGLGRREEAARMFHKAGDFLAAAEIWAHENRLEEAAVAFAAGNEHDQAARIMEQLGNPEKAAKYWKAAGEYLKAAIIYYKAGREKAALKLLGQVGELGDNARPARAMEGQILFKLGNPKAALERFRVALGDSAPSRQTVDLFYKIGRCQEALGEISQALESFEVVVTHNERFADARSRMGKLRSKLPAAEPHKGKASPAPRRDSRDPSGVASNRLRHARYDIVDEIARGGMGVVYKARDKVLNRIVAFKILSESLKTNRTAVEYFLREARAAAAMSHPNIVTVFDAGEQDNEYYMAMEYVEGETLKSLVKRQGAFPEPLVRFVAVHSCRGLTYAHDKGLVHRDIKSGNLMLTKDRNLKIMDFGLAKFVEESQKDHTRAIGTPYYMSPEQILGKDLDGRSDIYSLGITLFECATGRVPFSKGDLAYHHLHTKPPTVRSLNGEISPQLERIIAKCIRKDPARRFQSATEFLEALKSISVVPAGGVR